MLPTVTVVIPTYRRAALLADALRPLLADPAATEVIVVVDGPDPQAEGVLASLAEHKLRVVTLPTNQGRTHARQQGVEAATCEVVLLLDDDVIANDNLVERHARHHSEHPNAVVVGPLLTNPHASVVSTLYARESAGVYRQYETDPSTVLRKLWGGNLSLRRNDALDIGIHAEGFERLGFEDTDFGLRCQAAGLQGVFDSTLTVEHRHERALPWFLSDAYQRGRGAVVLQQRHHEEVLRIRPSRPLQWIASQPSVLRLLRKLCEQQGIIDQQRAK